MGIYSGPWAAFLRRRFAASLQSRALARGGALEGFKEDDKEDEGKQKVHSTLSLAAAWPAVTAVSLKSRGKHVRCGEAAVRSAFARCGVPLENVHLLKGYVQDTLPTSSISEIAVLRIDVDLASATASVLEHLYSRVQVGGFIIVDDYYTFPECADVVDSFREVHGCQNSLEVIDDEGVYWRK